MNFETNESSFYFFYSTLFAIITLRGAKKFKATTTPTKTITLPDVIGSTPLLYLPRLSAMFGIRVFGKAEYFNPGGSVKDRAALFMIQSAVRSGELKPGGLVVEGTGGNTGVALSMICASLGYKCYLTMPTNVSLEKQLTMKAFGATIELCDTKFGVSDAGHYTQRAKAVAKERGGVHTDQFYNLANSTSHSSQTAPELVSQLCSLNISDYIFATGAGTGGTISGVAKHLGHLSEKPPVVLVDFEGSGMKAYLKTGQFTKAPGNTEAEGVGISRLTRNFASGFKHIDGSVSVSDIEVAKMCRYLAEEEGVWVGPSASGNVVGAVKAGLREKQERGEGGEEVTVVTILCDSGASYLSKMYNKEWREGVGLGDAGTLGRGDLDLELNGGFVPRGEDSLFEGHVGGG
ncbi:hypothetical protein TrCOL_g9760 [Triparma columacea]|uniref:Tryptophan synthase beta chain-like PALP domain-containing protein n=1 Tax=Triparma columacea TaxID=722753 RepID=A0A9W7GCK8_9STRA|nr:hypothetical protein TrCOL_g9760 [Triparma columacea]